MSNFEFLKTKEWAPIYAAARRAEEYVRGDPRTALFHGRRAVELIVNWLYDFDPAFQRPYDDGLSSLMHDASFKNNVPYAIQQKMHALRKLGNTAVHDRRPANPDEARAMIEELFHIAHWFGRTYTQGDPNSVPDQFDAAKLPAPRADLVRHSIKALQQRQQQIEEKDEALREQQQQNETLLATIASLQEQISVRKVVNDAIPDRHDYSEAETRQLLIDLYLREAGWVPNDENVPEFRVEPFPNKAGYGLVDYVLWGADGLPLAVVEAKRTTVDAHRGKQQAVLYADALEEMYGRRPLIFYTNGFEIWFWDDQRYPERPLHGFYTRDEMELAIQRRQSMRDLAGVTINKAIVDRYYQEEGIRRVTEHLSLGHRRALLVMATGTGKTRVAIALVDLLMRAGWVKRALFLADRTTLVNQAVRAFKKHLPASNPVSLPELDDKADAEASRVVVSTYHSMINQIDAAREDGVRLFGPGHFDLLIIDEAHRSVYRKFGAIFDYFDSLLLGLTATPKDEVDRNTYHLFNLQKGVPTYAYDLDTAVADGTLTPPVLQSVPTKFLRQGIHYDELSAEEQEDWDMLEWPDEGHAPQVVEKSALTQWLFNEDTVDKVLATLMEHGIKVAGGDRLGKTILFARNHLHAEFIRERFDANYPHLRGHFARVIDNYQSYPQTLIDDFSATNKMPQLAISVDMLDTGVDVPDVVNLVYFKPVHSKVKFYQMLGRGTRLRPDLFGPGLDKEYFFVFDFCENFEFFRANPEGVKTTAVEPLSQRIFKRRLDLLQALRQANDPELQPLAEDIADRLHTVVAAMNVDNFIVRPKRQYVEPFQGRARWDNMSRSDYRDLALHVSGLPAQLVEEEESAKRFDLLLLETQLARLNGQEAAMARLKERVGKTAGLLLDSTTKNISVVKEREATLEAVNSEEFWEEVTLNQLEDVRRNLREVTRFIVKDERNPIYTNIGDELGAIREADPSFLAGDMQLAQYRRKVQQFVREHEDYVVIEKIKWGMPLTEEDLAALEDFFYEAEETGTRDEFTAVYGTEQSLPAFIRSLVGLDRQAAKKLFAQFLDGQSYTADQITFVNYIIDHLTKNGTMEPALLYERPFTDVHYGGPEGVFSDDQANELVKVLVGVNNSIAI